MKNHYINVVSYKLHRDFWSIKSLLLKVATRDETREKLGCARAGFGYKKSSRFHLPVAIDLEKRP